MADARIVVTAVDAASAAIQQITGKFDGLNNSVEDNAQKMRASATSISDGIGGIAAKLAGLVGIAGGAYGLGRLADDFTALRARLDLASAGLGSAEEAYRRLYSIAQETRTPVAGLTEVFARLAVAGKELGVSQDRLLGVTQTISKAMTITGGSAESMRAAIIQLGQGLASGTLRGEELNSVMEQTPRLAKAIADGLGVPIGKLREMGKAGEITSEQIIVALERVAGDIDAEFGKIPLTIGGALTQVQNATLNLVGSLDKATGASGLVAKALKLVADNIDIVAVAATALIATGIAAWLATTLPTAIAATSAAFAFLTGPIGLVVAGVTAAVAGFTLLWAKMKEGKESLEVARAELMELQAALAKQPNNLILRNHVKDQLELVAALELEAQTRREAAGQMRGLAALKAQDAAEDKKRGEALAFVNEQQRIASGQTADFQSKLAKLADAYSKGLIPSVEEYRRLVVDLIQREGGVKKAVDDRRKSAEDFGRVAKRLHDDEMKRLKDQADAEIKASKDKREALEKLTKARDDGIKKLDESAQSIEEQVEKLKDEEEAARIAAASNVSLSVAIELVAIRRLENKRAAYEEEGASEASIAAVEREIAARKELIGYLNSREAREAAAKGAEDASNEWDKAAQTIEQSLTDALMRGFEGGKSWASNFKDTLVNLFKSLVLRPIIQPIASGLSSSVLGMLGMAPGAAGAAGGADLLSGGGLLAQAFGGYGNFLTGLTSLQTPAAAFNQFLMGGSGTQFVGAMAPYALGLYAAYRIISGKGTGRDRSPAMQNFSYLNSAGLAATSPWATPNLQSGSAYDDLLKPIIGGVSETASMFGGRAGALTYGLMTSVSPDGKGGQVVAEVADAIGKRLFIYNENGTNETVDQRLKEQIPRLFIAGLQGANLPKVFADWFAKIDPNTATQEQIDASILTASAAKTMADNTEMLGGAFLQLSGLSVEARSNILALSGGLDSFMQKTAQYLDLYYTDEEKASISAYNVAKRLTDVGIDIAGLDTAPEFRQIVESLDLSTAVGQAQFAALMEVAPLFYQLTTWMKDNKVDLDQLSGGIFNKVPGVEQIVAGPSPTPDDEFSTTAPWLPELKKAWDGSITTMTTNLDTTLTDMGSKFAQGVIDVGVVVSNAITTGFNTLASRPIEVTITQSEVNGGLA